MDARGGLSWAASASISVSSAREQSCRVMVRLGTGLAHVCGLTVVTLTVSYADSSYRNSGGPAKV
jgi:hypothetical protein